MTRLILLISFFFVFISPPEPPSSVIIAEALTVAAPVPSPTVTPTPICTPIPTPVPAIYDAFTEEELDLLFRVVECEARGGSLQAKTNVASVIFNRVKTGWQDGDLTSILMSPRQFEVVTLGVYKTAKPTATTIQGCELAFEKDSVDGAVYFDCTNGESWAAEQCKKGKLVWVMRDDIGHDFYRKPRKGE